MTNSEILKNINPSDLLKHYAGKKVVFTKDFKGRVVIPGNTVITTNQHCTLFTVVVDRVTPKGIKDANGRFYHSSRIYRLDE